LPRVSGGIATLLHAIGQQPVLVAGHSAGAAVAVRMALDASVCPIAVISLNGALLPFPGMANDFFRPAARFLASSSITAKTFSLFAGSRTSVEKMLRSTGSSIDPEGARLYARLAGNSGHVHGALALMANWDLRPLVRDLPRLTPDLVLVTGSRDGMVPPSESYRIRSVVPKARLVSLSGLGHLAHEERPDKIVGIIGTTITPCPAGGTTSPQPPTFQSCSPRHT
jgi:magnesium chelatase accessory protein